MSRTMPLLSLWAFVSGFRVYFTLPYIYIYIYIYIISLKYETKLRDEPHAPLQLKHFSRTWDQSCFLSDL
jgi:hypothetical protein